VVNVIVLAGRDAPGRLLGNAAMPIEFEFDILPM
jgi:hypothetical protein